MIAASVLIKKYSCAFVNIFHGELSVSVIDNIDRCHKYLKGHREALFYLRLSAIPDSVKDGMLRNLFNNFNLKAPFDSLISILTKDKRLYLIEEIMAKISMLAKQMNGIIDCTVSSAVPLADEQRREIESLLVEKTRKKVRITYVIDKNLIAGIRIVSAIFLWEYSVRQQLRLLEQFI
jgi:ATP synthase F1 delta subunit